MSISLNREGNSDGTIDYSENIATTKFYNKYWDPAIKELGIRIFEENGYFNKSQLNDIIIELRMLKSGLAKI